MIRVAKDRLDQTLEALPRMVMAEAANSGWLPAARARPERKERGRGEMRGWTVALRRRGLLYQVGNCVCRYWSSSKVR
jgi:hypothetical protein